MLVLRTTLAVSLLVVTGARPASRDVRHDESTIVIGEVLPLTGDIASFGRSTRRGIDLALDEINSKGGVKGRKLAMAVEDDRGSSAEAAAATARLAQNPAVIAIIGEVASSVTLGMARIAQQNQVPLVTPTATLPRLTTMGDYVFRTCIIDPVQGQVMARFARKSLGASRIAILHDNGSDYSAGLTDAFEKTWTSSLGGTVTSRETYQKGEVDFRSQLKRIAQSQPEAVYVPGYYIDVMLIAQQAKELGLKVPLLGGDGWDSEKLFAAGDAIVGSYFANHGTSDDPSPEYRAFVAAFQKKFKGEKPDVLAAQGYLTAYVLADAFSQAKTLTRADVRQALAEVRNLPTITGNLSIDANRNAVKPLVILRVEKGERFVFQERIEP